MVSKHSTPQVIVLKPGAAVPSASTRLFNLSTNQLNLAVGAASIFRPVSGSGNPEVMPTSGVTLLNTPYIQVIQRRDQSGDSAPLPERSMEKTDNISLGCVFGLKAKGKAVTQPKNDLWLINETLSMVAADETLYEIHVGSDGYRQDLYYSHYNTPIDRTDFTTPDWSTTAFSTAEQKLDYTFKALADKYNTNSMNSVMLTLSSTDAGATTGSTTVADAGALAVGSLLTIGYDRNANPVQVLINASIKKSLLDLEAYAIATLGLTAGDLTILPYAYPTAQNVAAVDAAIVYGGGTVDMLSVLALEYKESYYDEIMANKSKLEVGFPAGFPATVTKTRVVAGSAGSGAGAELRKYYEYEQDFGKYPSRKRWNGYHISYPNGILENATYDYITVEYCDTRVATNGMPSYSPRLLVIAIVSFTDANTSYYTGSANPQKTAILAQLNAWLTAAGQATVSL